MKFVNGLMSLAVLTLVVAATAGAQQKEIAGEMTTVKGTVEAIDHAQRVLTLKTEDGEFVNLNVPQGAKRFDEVEVADAVQVRYYDNVTIRVKDPGEKDINSAEAGIKRNTGANPGATVSAQRSMTVKVTAIDHVKGVATVEGPNGYKYSRRIQDKAAAKKVNVGDKLDMTWTEAVQISVIPQ